MSDSSICKECGMALTRANEYHPYAACLMYKQVHDAEVVRVNLRAVVDYGVAFVNRTLAPQFVDMVRARFKDSKTVTVHVAKTGGTVSLDGDNAGHWDRSKGQSINTALEKLDGTAKTSN